MIENPRKILIIKLRYLGDVLLSTPVFRNLRLAYPSVRLDVVVNPGTDGVLKRNPDVDHVYSAERGTFSRQIAFIKNLRRTGYDMVIDLTDSDRSAIISYLSGARLRVGYNQEGRWRGRCYTNVVSADRSSMHTVDYQLEALKTLQIPVKTSELIFPLIPQDEAFAKDVFSEYGLGDGKPVVLVHPGARWWFKSWPSEYFADVADRIQLDLDGHVIFAGDDSDKTKVFEIQDRMKTKAFSLAGKTTVHELAGLLKRCHLFIGNDNGMMHVAAAIGTPVIAFFGLTSPVLWGPRGGGHKVFYKGIDCSPCFPKGCIRGDQSCMRMISVHEVFAAVQELLAICARGPGQREVDLPKCEL